MKKVLLSISILAFAASFAQTTYYSASSAAEFQTGLIVDADQDGKNWGVYDLQAGGGAGTSFDAQGEVLGSNSWDTVALTPDNWYVSSAINLTGATNASLRWGRAAIDPQWPAEKYSVYVVTGADQAAVIAALQAATPVFTETIATGGVWATKSVAINTFAGQNNVYVAFRHHECTDQFLLIIDDIKVDNVANIEDLPMVDAKVYPNPANDELNISLDGEVENVTITSMDGKVVATSSSSKVNVATLEAGMYVYNVTTVEGKVAKGNFIKK
jgi:hypothetical protein